jgi:proline-specific peptidase
VNVELRDGVTLYVKELGAGFPLILLHGGPGLDHTHLSPYLDSLAGEFRLVYIDERGQGRSELVDPTTLSLEVFGRDVDLLAEALGLDEFALFGHSFGAILATWHAINVGSAAAYVISGGGDSSENLMADVGASLEAMGGVGRPIAESWEREKSVRTDEEVLDVLRVQMPFHFAGEPPPDFAEETVCSPDVLRYFARNGYGDFDYTADLGRVEKPTLVIVGELDRTTTTRAARILHEGIPGSELAVVPGVGHMSFVERPNDYLNAVRGFLVRSTPPLT